MTFIYWKCLNFLSGCNCLYLLLQSCNRRCMVWVPGRVSSNNCSDGIRSASLNADAASRARQHDCLIVRNSDIHSALGKLEASLPFPKQSVKGSSLPQS